MSGTRKQRQWPREQKPEAFLAGLRRDRMVWGVCLECEIYEALCYSWRATLLEGGKVALANPQTRTPDHAEIVELKKKVASLERSLGRRTYTVGLFRLTHPSELWHLDMITAWTAAHVCVYLHIAVDVRTRTTEVIDCVEAAVHAH